jgi:hypothetical protein
VAPILGFALRASRRTRLRNQAVSYVKLATTVEEADPASAALVRELVGETVTALVESERRSLTRRFDPSALLTIALLVTPAAIVFAWALTRSEWWAWLVIGGSVVWAVLVVVGGVQNLWVAHEGTDQTTDMPPTDPT